MVEGHGVHRVAIAHRKKLLNAAFRATSPNGRFTEGAAAIDGRVLNRVEAHGKNLFYFFGFGEKEQEQLHANTRSSERKEGLEGEREGDENGCVVIHVHFGMSGQFRLHRPPGPEPKSTTRLILQNNKIAAYLSAMTCQHGGQELYDQKVAELGPDPLREDANPERLWQRLQSTSRSVGQMLMDQSVVAGVGNIYRAEILYRVGLHPEQPSNTLSYEDYRRLWKDCVITLQRGVTTGSILTVDPDEKLPEPYKRRYIYNHSKCPRCHGPVSIPREREREHQTTTSITTLQTVDPTTKQIQRYERRNRIFTLRERKKKACYQAGGRGKRWKDVRKYAKAWNNQESRDCSRRFS